MRNPSTVRRCSTLVTSASLVALLAVVLSGQATDAAAVLASAHAALGGEAALTGVKTLVAVGRTRQIRGNNTVPVEFEITCQLPDLCVRREEYPAQSLEPTTIGFRGDTLIQAPGAVLTGPPAAARLVSVQHEFARLLLGGFAGAVTVHPLSFSYAAEAEAPEGKADVLNVLGSSNFVSQLVVHRETHLPVMLSWQTPAATGAVPQPVGAGSAAPPAPAASVEHRLYYADYRSVNGLKWPFRLRRSVAGTTIEETTFDRVRLNVAVDTRKLESGR